MSGDAMKAAVKKILSARYPEAQGGSVEGFDVYGSDDVFVDHYVIYGDRVAKRAERLPIYAAMLEGSYDVRCICEGTREARLIVSEKQSKAVDDDDLADALRTAYQSGGERTREAWLAVAQKARELLR